ncbi:MAG: DUF4388 domain-containing protein [Proteobacteria bacterium]|nr:DUF4388 domain-containing protein [Pseudomonadota bacterium]NIS72366.1 DUF4388 domain-containing protein [Pseudomonadota bacterium]
MALQGSLRDFKFTEIIQLIGQQFKTGVFHVESGRKVVEIFFLDGLIVHVLATHRSKRDLLGEILLKAGKISQEDLEKVLKTQDETLQYTGEIMVELRLLTEEEIVRVISTQVYETVYDLFSWKDGNFRFEPQAVESYKKISIALSPEHVLLNILRMIDEWPEIEGRISSLYVVFNKVKPLAKDEGGISPEQRLVYELADGKLTIQEIIDRSLLGKFNVCEAMVALWDQGYVERVGTQKPSFTRMMGARVGLRSLAGIQTLLTYGMVLTTAVVLFLFLKSAVLSEAPVGEVTMSPPQSFVHQVTSERIRKALAVYYLENGEYPESLQDLFNLGLIHAQDTYLQDGRPFRYKRKEEGGYTLKP